MPELTLHNGDCLEMMKAIPDKSVDLIICDLPYGCLTSPKIGGQANIRLPENRCSWDVKIDLEAFWKQVKRIRRSDHSPTIHFVTTKFGYEVIKSNPDEFRYDLVWDKQRGVSFLSANKMPMRSHEMIYVFSKAGAYYNRIDMTGNWGAKSRTATENNGTTRCVLSVIQTPNKTLRKSAHPTEKPDALYRWLIERYCPADGTVLDPTFGSGNSVFTAFALGRNAIGIEKDEKFFEKAETRLNALP